MNYDRPKFAVDDRATLAEVWGVRTGNRKKVGMSGRISNIPGCGRREVILDDGTLIHAYTDELEPCTLSASEQAQRYMQGKMRGCAEGYVSLAEVEKAIAAYKETLPKQYDVKIKVGYGSTIVRVEGEEARERACKAAYELKDMGFDVEPSWKSVSR